MPTTARRRRGRRRKEGRVLRFARTGRHNSIRPRAHPSSRALRLIAANSRTVRENAYKTFARRRRSSRRRQTSRLPRARVTSYVARRVGRGTPVGSHFPKSREYLRGSMPHSLVGMPAREYDSRERKYRIQRMFGNFGECR